MSRFTAFMLGASCLVAAGCAPERGTENNAAATGAAANDAAAANAASPGPGDGGTTGLPCAFREARDWAGSVNAMPGTDPGRPKLGVSGKVRVQQAGYTAKLVELRGSGPPELRLDLLLAEPTGPLPKIEWHDVTFSKTRSPLYTRAVVMCGGEEFARFDIKVTQ